MPQMHPWQLRLFLVAMATSVGLVWYGFINSPQVEVLWPSTWPIWYAAIAISTIVFAIVPWSDLIFTITGLLTPVCCFLRLFAVAANAHAHVYADPARMWIGFGQYLGYGILWATAWVFCVGPTHAWERAHRGVT